MTKDDNGALVETGVNKADERKKAKHQKKKEQKKRQKQKKISQLQDQSNNNTSNSSSNNNNNNNNRKKQENGNGIHKDNIENNANGDDHVDEDMGEQEEEFLIDESDPTFELYNKLLKHFDNPTGYSEEDEQQKEQDKAEQEEEQQKEIAIKEEPKDIDDNGESDEEENDNDKPSKMSNRERKRQQKLNLPILKQLVDRPDIVELHDTNSPNPSFLISMKSTRNSVSVPTHWCQKRKYLQGKRGYVKQPFELPEFIAATGITKIREALLEKSAQQKTKTKQRERLQPKMRTMNIDYHVLRDAFFIHQTKPKLCIQGELYYEGKEFEVSIKKTKPGVLSEDLRRALGMADNYPPPWLIHMQTHGPPPSYPNLKVQGVNAPIPEGAQYGFHAGGWGKPPADLQQQYANANSHTNAIIDSLTAPVEKEHWGELLAEEEYEEEQQEDEEDVDQQEDEEPEESDISEGISSVPSGLETPDTIDIKKGRQQQQDAGQPRQLYQVLDQTSRTIGSGIMESNYKYNVPSTIKTSTTTTTPGRGSNKVDIIKSQRSAPVDITFNPSELEDMNELDEDLLKKKYEQAVAAEKGPQKPKEDLSNVADDHKKRKIRSNLLERTAKNNSGLSTIIFIFTFTKKVYYKHVSTILRISKKNKNDMILIKSIFLRNNNLRMHLSRVSSELII
ncbi:PSP proline-rich domain-containing protein [Heterostelium album PN500]|uniref:PSP proline-rich domain-containing protein n=1 Tax=Heterostelium pallidum (strain ATCC 26659 / Pp 5 / PN500) TaxID=670386 RepID=D3BIF4_HETP5|nr:PSP proline-rich domain-containing protein [Heterostelium album PN500]EFA79054.1 PSP proline-rich domain-containing protein [Heterostelium album PN500]|eukprot:XP_020431177.1 PSP proline-rich domain-containing protein [Heterostelium album PN500]